jgi:hypothetical protein
LNQEFLLLGVVFVLIGIIAASFGRRRPNASGGGDGKKGSPLGTIGMFFLGLGVVLAIIGL